MMHVPRVKHKIPDTLSRYPVSCDGPNDTINDAVEKASTFAFTTAHNLQAVTWDRVKVATQSDKSMLQLLTTMYSEWLSCIHTGSSQRYSGIPPIQR